MTYRRLLTLIAALAVLALPAAALAETWTNASLVDTMCAKKAKEADAHTRDCAIKCASSGYGIFTADGRYLKLDEKGYQLALDALKASEQQDHLRVDVQGKLEDGTIAVETLALVRAE